ncbi:class II aldolase/adducin family protein [Limibaculum sp. M0105]|uniref:Class II aldolase/adducin family protein n=1 Tax=Thermohalobaculum xanthum TaxID=2753746 RepID=A0A8J7M3I2_9RHOB|nr:class II aldolase and adducin N-terminal domain-containing protein [Thermohalobaculum xanthum]MBK0397615.1 class II aldolase/adducin family protein [Thermohalobaculum xanthum]
MSATPMPRRETNIAHWAERCDLAAAFRWTARLGLHEAVANHFSLAVDDAGTRFLMNPNQRHFSLITASSLLEIDANDPETMNRPDAPDATAWGLHGALHRLCPHARCAMHVHSVHATVLACLEDPRLPPLDQNSAMFHGKVAIDQHYGGLALDEEAERACSALADPSKCVLVMGNHGVMVVGETVAQTFNRLYYFERAAETYIKALWTGRPLRYLSDEIAARTAAEIDEYGGFAERHLGELRAILDREEPEYAR